MYVYLFIEGIGREVIPGGADQRPGRVRGPPPGLSEDRHNDVHSEQDTERAARSQAHQS